MLFEDPSLANTVTNKHQKTNFETVHHPHLRIHSHMHPVSRLINEMPRFSNIPSIPNHSSHPVFSLGRAEFITAFLKCSWC